MKHIKLLILFIFALSSATFINTVAAAPESIQSDIDLSQFTSKRQVVDQLLNDAYQTFKSPARISTAGFTAKMPSNMELITERLLQAYKIEPYRTDLLISAANAQVYNGNIDKAITLFENVLTVALYDLDAHSYLAIWQHFKNNEKEVQKHLDALQVINAGRVEDIKKIMSTVDRIVQTPLKNQSIRHEGKTAIVTLGYALNPDGSMHDILIDRLNITLEMAKNNLILIL